MAALPQHPQWPATTLPYSRRFYLQISPQDGPRRLHSTFVHGAHVFAPKHSREEEVGVPSIKNRLHEVRVVM